MFVYTIGDVLAMSFWILLIALVLTVFIFQTVRQKLCKHKDTFKRGTNLHTICRTCDKDLGFRDKELTGGNNEKE